MFVIKCNKNFNLKGQVNTNMNTSDCIVSVSHWYTMIVNLREKKISNIFNCKKEKEKKVNLINIKVQERLHEIYKTFKEY